MKRLSAMAREVQAELKPGRVNWQYSLMQRSNAKRPEHHKAI
jgi:hypothetical protein